MAKTRELVRELFQLILEDAAEPARRHICEESKKYGSCVICSSGVPKFVFVYTALLRQAGLLDNELMESEQMLLEILGEKRYNNILREQTRAFMSGPSKKCTNCKAKIKILDSYTSAYERLRKSGPRNYYCHNCGTKLTFNHNDFPVPKKHSQKMKKKGLNLTDALLLGDQPTRRRGARVRPNVIEYLTNLDNTNQTITWRTDGTGNG